MGEVMGHGNCAHQALAPFCLLKISAILTGVSGQLHCEDGIFSMISDAVFKTLLNIMIQHVEGQVEEDNMLRINRDEKVAIKSGSSPSYMTELQPPSGT
jgi:hypothetical protein